MSLSSVGTAYVVTPGAGVDELCNRFAGPGKAVQWDLVYPPVQALYRAALAECKKEGADYYATCGTRTYQQQTALYLQGRNTPGPHAGEEHYPEKGLTVTKSRPGESAHNFGIAVDSTRDADLTRAGLQPDWKLEDYEILARHAKKQGLHSLFYSAEFREGPHCELDLESRGLTKRLLRMEFERRGFHDLKAGLADAWALLDRHGPWGGV